MWVWARVEEGVTRRLDPYLDPEQTRTANGAVIAEEICMENGRDL